ncbi:hypothetical protein HanXRQr2_Chr13g0613441 [Helianthus annuus]|uniref:Uncharacterized protein n=1 Tax=Helianthus annuus TaxID=4232 RepID=A0A9K3ELM2_HELAN|nr:hypothetical protein HanXRQr2_Chr13g0613441 [Helianthus annuus]
MSRRSKYSHIYTVKIYESKSLLERENVKEEQRSPESFPEQHPAYHETSLSAKRHKNF